MTSHELAKELLRMPDLLVAFPRGESDDWEEITRIVEAKANTARPVWTSTKPFEGAVILLE